MAMYVLERFVRQRTGSRVRRRWTQYAFCAKRRPLERVLNGLGGTAEWRIRKTAAATKTVDKAA